MEQLAEQLALARIREREMRVAPERLEAVGVARQHDNERRALAWERLAGWAAARAQRARCL